MHRLSLTGAGPVRRVLCLGAHADDIEIGCAGTLLQLLAGNSGVHVDYVVCTATSEREQEARVCAAELLSAAKSVNFVFQAFRNGYFPYIGAEIKDFFELLKAELSPDLIFTHGRSDRHQDHRVVGELTWNTFRDHLILEYEIPKYDGELPPPNTYVTLSEEAAARKLDLLGRHFPSQHAKAWFDESSFRGLMRLRGIECQSPSGYAEAFSGRKLALSMS